MSHHLILTVFSVLVIGIAIIIPLLTISACANLIAYLLMRNKTADRYQLGHAQCEMVLIFCEQ